MSINQTANAAAVAVVDQPCTAPPPGLNPPADRRFSGLPRSFWIVFAGTVANRVGDMVTPFLVFILGSRGFPASAIGTIAVALGVGGLVGPALGGWLGDRFSHRTALVGGLVATSASLGALFASPSLWLLLVSAVALGVTGKVYPAPANALVADDVTAEARPRAMSLLHWAVNIGTAIAASSAGFLAARGYWLLFVIDAVTCLVFAVIVFLGVPRGRRMPTHHQGGAGYRVVWRDRTMVAFTVLAVGGFTVYSMTEFAIPLTVRAHGFSPAVYGVMAAVNAVAVVVAQPVLYGPLSRLPRVRVLAASWALVAIGVASTGLAHQVWQYIATTIVWSLGEVGNGVVAGGIVADLAPVGARGRYQGVFNWSFAAGRLAAPALVTILVAAGGSGALWWVVLILGLASAAMVARLGPPIAARTRRS